MDIRKTLEEVRNISDDRRKDLEDRLQRINKHYRKIELDIQKAKAHERKRRTHALLCFAGAVLKQDPAFAEQVLALVEQDKEAPAGHAQAIRWLLNEQRDAVLSEISKEQARKKAIFSGVHR